MAGSITVVVGTQWGDEGKGKLVDLLSTDAELCIRFQGGGNAGHTVVNKFGTFKLHLVPCGIFNPDCQCIMGTGTVIDPQDLIDEMQTFVEQNVSVENLFISDRAHVVMPYHKLFDRLEDEARGAYRVGTTGRGIGPAYTDKYARIGIRFHDLLHEESLRQKLSVILPRHNALLTHVYNQQALDLEQLVAQCIAWGRQLKPRIVDTVPMIRTALQSNRKIILEGQLSAMKDIDWGSYPYVTSSSPTAAGAAAGSGIPPRYLTEVIGVAKAYSTQVGTGPMPTELSGDEADHLRQLGSEYGATTGRPRRVGWFDAVVTRYVAEINGCTAISVTKMDVLDTMAEIPVCVAYRYQGELIHDLPDPQIHELCEPVYEVLPGWLESTEQARALEDLPRNARLYLERLAELVQVPIHSVGVGPDRAQTLVL
ncbi:adenylosuccinate synthase [Tengunoibacter tsumagoiensis]|uniref:Adenylosuccinate synthetase n=1 Tax=Tengunoibacter tsumagoiensis TaxID=2014871 RepID=A0A402A6E6_9CHLR|nr:adenylosuccinate synthase [Tengunoibacter tsumagoiensis]GCE14698.1 adenylosuccinate synthetase [Tengunoibacter tsumagoiensis]